LALTPQNDEAFLREVDEELRRDQLGSFWRRYGRLLIALVIVGLAVFGGFLWWQADKQKKAGLASEDFNGALQAIGQGRDADANRTLKPLADSKTPGYRGAARLALAARAMEKGDAAGAAASYANIAADESLSKPIRDLALVRGTSAVFDTLKPEIVIERLKPLAIAGEPWFGSAGEMTAVAWLKLNKPEKAASMFAALAADKQVPDSIRARATRIASALGIDTAGKQAASGEE